MPIILHLVLIFTLSLTLALGSLSPGLAQQEPTRNMEELTLSTAISRALQADPTLTSSTFDIRANEARLVQSRLRPNPEFSFEVENAFGSGELRNFKAAELTAEFEQLIELGGKRRARIAAAESAMGVATADSEIVKRSLIVRVTGDFVSLLGAERRLAIASERVTLANQLLPALRARVDAGASSPVDLTRGELALELAKLEADRTETGLAGARRLLVANWAGPEQEALRVKGDLDPPNGDLVDLPLLVTALDSHPLISRWDAERFRREAESGLERSARIPDVTLGVGARQFEETDDVAVLFSASIPIPVWNRNQGAILEAQHLTSKAEAELKAARLALYRQLSDAYASMSAACSEAIGLNTTVIPKAQRTLGRLEQGYQQGRFGVLDLLDANELLADVKSQHIDRLIDCRAQSAFIESLTGMSAWTRGRGSDNARVAP